jgi:hypothetical protein
VTSYLEPLSVNKVYHNMPRGDKGGNSKGSGVRCVAANCGNTNADGVSLHTFPKDPTLLKKWSDFVKLKRGLGLDLQSIRHYAPYISNLVAFLFELDSK